MEPSHQELQLQHQPITSYQLIKTGLDFGHHLCYPKVLNMIHPRTKNQEAEALPKGTFELIKI